MSDSNEIGKIEWLDLSVDKAESIKDFYCNVIGWKSAPVSMGDYEDYAIKREGSDEAVAGICHARGPNKNLPAQWLVYVRVESVAESSTRCLAAGGKILDGPRELDGSLFCVIQDPAGAIMALLSKH